MSELEKFGLLEKRRRGRGLPNILYLKDFRSGITEVRSTENGNSRPADAGISEKGDAEVHQSAPEEVRQRGPEEVRNSAPLKNYTYLNHTKRNYTVSHRISSSEPDGRQDGMRCDGIRELNACRKTIEENISFDVLRHDLSVYDGRKPAG